MQQILRIYRLLGVRRRRQLLLTLGMMLLGALAEMITIGAALSFLLLLSGASGVRLPEWLRDLFEASGLDSILGASLALIAAAVAAAILRVALVRLSGRMATDIALDMAVQIFGRTLRQPYSSFVQRNSSEVISGINNIQLIVTGLFLPGMHGIVGGVLALAIGTLLFVIHPFVATVVIAIVGCAYALVSLVTRSRLRRNADILRHTAVSRIKMVQEGVGGIRDIILDQSYRVFEGQFAAEEKRFRDAQAATNFIALAPRYIVEGAGIIALVLVALIMSRQPGGLDEAIPVIGALALGAQRLLPLLQQAYWGLAQGRGNMALLTDLLTIIDQPLASIRHRAPVPPDRQFRDSIVFDSVGFEYPGTGFAVSDISVSIARGSRIGVMGVTGSGKSTFLDLLMGLLEPTAGEIRIDDRTLSEADIPIWQAQVAHVPQAIFLSDDSIAANIAFGADEEVDPARLRAAAEAACLAGFVATLPDGYETVVGERGIRLSGGQRQRIGLARALYKGASVLVLDEATSALDDATEAEVMRSLAGLGTDVTLIMVAHRTSTLAACDRILRIENGRLA